MIARPSGGYRHEHYVFKTLLEKELKAEKELRDQDLVAAAIDTFEQLGRIGKELRECVSNGVHLECQ